MEHVKKRLLSLLMAFAMVLGLLPFSVLGVTGSEVAQDGEYSARLIGYKEGKQKYTGTLTVEVKNGLINSLSISNASDSKLYKSLTAQLIAAFTNIEASLDTVSAVEDIGVDATSGATTASSQSGRAKYSISLKESILAALGKASPVEDPGGNAETYTKTFTIDKYTATVTITVENGKVTDISVSGDGNWTTPLADARSKLVGQNKPSANVDAISSATIYSQALEDAINEALEQSADGGDPVVEPPKIIEGKDQSWKKNSGEDLSIISDANYADFLRVEMDGSTVNENNFTVKSGSTVVTLNASYLDTLSQGSHTLGIVSRSGTASTTITVSDSSSGGGESGGGESGGGESGGTYTGTAVEELTDGDYLIVDRYSNAYSYYALSNATGGSSGGGYGFTGVEASFDGTTATVTDSTASVIWTYSAATKSFYNAASGKYLNLPSSSYNSGNFFSSSPVALTFYTIGGKEATVYAPYGNGGYYLNAAYPSGDKAFGSSYTRYVNSSYLSSGSGVYFCKVETKQPSSITLSGTEIILSAGKSATVTATLTGCTISGAVSDDTSVATVERNGNGSLTIRGVSAGTATITVSGTGDTDYQDPAAQTITVTVVEPPAHVKSISGSGDDYTISLNVMGKDATTSTTTNGTNLVLVIDVSGSIRGKETALNSAIKRLVETLPGSSQVGVVTFNDSAQSSRIYTADTISGLSFSGVENAATNMATGISAAFTLLSGSGWNKSNNDKAMVIISDFDIDDYANAINAAKTAKDGGTTIYSVKIDATSVSAAGMTELTSDNKADSIPAATRYISSQYPSASAVNNSMFGMFNQATVTPGTADNSMTYVFGAGGGNWEEIFAEIEAEQGITEETTSVSNVTITDTLSQYVEKNGEVTVTGPDGSTLSGAVVQWTNSNTRISITLPGELEDGKTYTVKIPVKPSQKAKDEATAPSSTFPSNAGATLTYQYGDASRVEVTYDEEPTITVEKQETGHKIIVVDYTKGGAETSIDPDKYYSGTVNFTVTADIATVVARFTDATEETKNSQDGTYERMYCTEENGTHTFTLSMPGDSDVYLVVGYKGDVGAPDGPDGKVNLKDSAYLRQVYVETRTANSLQKLLGDVDVNGTVNLKDAALVSQVYVGNRTFSWDAQN